ncbi:hypothetical protein TrLO_g1374 [Triparma laevis f. longispina]|uniref:Uncharacterized protein n=1 Tax=Triparma laevis f. longispina TaxID=1714387 RepID=A0A9W7FTC8_9STRA|nr:hypothetical protein TrLO_g1374 [Triparma laevis f. longispina]
MDDSNYEEESFSSESYGSDFDDDAEDPTPSKQPIPTLSKSSPVKTMRMTEPTEKVMSIDALGDLMGHLDEQLAQGTQIDDSNGGDRSSLGPPKAAASSSPLKQPEPSTFGSSSKKYEDATSNVKSMSDLDDLMSALDQYDDVDTTVPKEVIEANKAAVHHKKFMSWSKRGPSKEEREAASPKLAKLVEQAKQQQQQADVIDEDIDYERDVMSAVVEEQKQKAAAANRASTRVKAASPPRRHISPAPAPTRLSRPKAAIPEPVKLQADDAIIHMLVNDISLNPTSTSLGRIRAAPSNNPNAPTRYSTTSRSDLPPPTMEDDFQIIPNMQYINGGVPLEFDDELPETIPVPRNARGKVVGLGASGGGENGKGGYGNGSSPKSPTRSKKSPVRSVRSPLSRNSGRASPSNSTRKSPAKSSSPANRKLTKKSVSASNASLPASYRAAFDTQYLMLLQRLGEASSNSNIENLTLEESRMGSVMSECLRDMLSNSEIIELLKMGCMKKLKAAGKK